MIRLNINQRFNGDVTKWAPNEIEFTKGRTFSLEGRPIKKTIHGVDFFAILKREGFRFKAQVCTESWKEAEYNWGTERQYVDLAPCSINHDAHNERPWHRWTRDESGYATIDICYRCQGTGTIPRGRGKSNYFWDLSRNVQHLIYGQPEHASTPEVVWSALFDARNDRPYTQDEIQLSAALGSSYTQWLHELKARTDDGLITQPLIEDYLNFWMFQRRDNVRVLDIQGHRFIKDVEGSYDFDAITSLLRLPENR